MTTNGIIIDDETGQGPVAMPDLSDYECAIFMGRALETEARQMFALSQKRGKKTLCVIAPENVLPDYLELIVGHAKLMDSFVIVAGDGSECPPRVNEIVATIDAIKERGSKSLH